MSLWKKTTDCLSRNNIAQLSRLGNLANRQHRLRLEPLEDRRMLSVLHVDADALAGGDGLAWGSAYDDLQLALDRAEVLNADEIETNDIDQIWIAEGSYLPTKRLEPENERSAAFSLLDHVALYGGFEGNEAALDQRDWATHETILSGDLGIQADTSDNAYTVVFCGENFEATLDGISITGGNADGPIYYANPEQARGGGIFNAGNLSVINSTISGNSADSVGGGICGSTDSTLSVTGSSISENSASSGGGISQDVGNLTVTNTTISNNSASSGGGGICGHKGSTVSVTSSSISENSASSDGGGINCFNDCELSLNNSIIENNTAGSRGGGVFFFYQGNLVVTDSTISGNTAYDDGGGIYAFHIDLTLVDSTVSDNSSTQSSGGGIYQRKGNLLITNTTISDNSAKDWASGINVDSCETVSIDSSTISNTNSAGIRIRNCFNSNIRDTEISENQYGVYLEGGELSIEGSIVTNCSQTGIVNEEGSLNISNSTVSNHSQGGIRSRGDLTITNSAISHNNATDYGIAGGIIIIGTATIEGSTISDNSTLGYMSGGGGGVHMGSGNCTITDTVISGNYSQYSGGGIYHSFGTLTVAESTFLNNTAAGYDGGAICSGSEGELSVSGSFFEGNYAEAGGGAIHNWGSGTVVDSVFTKNTAGGHGGALANMGTFCLSGLTVTGNKSTGEGYWVMGGGGISNQDVMTIADSTIVGNQAAQGGGVYNSHQGGTHFGDLTVVNTQMAGNTAVDGGGIYNLDTMNLTSVTTSGNTAENGGGIYNCADTLFLHNSIVSLNETSSGAEISGIVTSLNSCLLGSDPKFIRNPSDGGDGWGDDPSTPEIDEGANDDYGDLRLRPNSPAIDAGDNSLAVDAEGNPLTTDLDGNPRIFGGTVDIGAYESDVNAPPRVVEVTIGQGNERSVIRRIDVGFHETVMDLLNADALQLSNLTTGEIIPADAMTVEVYPDNFTATWTFPGLPGGRLPDGNYSATIPADAVVDPTGNPMAADYTFEFHSFFGDSDGDRDVDFADLFRFRKTYQKTSTDVGFDFRFDLDADDDVDTADLFAFRQNYLKALGTTPPSGSPIEVTAPISSRMQQAAILPFLTSKNSAPPEITYGPVQRPAERGVKISHDFFASRVGLPEPVSQEPLAANSTLNESLLTTLAMDLQQRQLNAKKSEKQESEQEKLMAAAYADYE